MIHCTHRIDYDLLLHIQTSNPVHLERCSTIISSASLDNYPSINLTIEKLKLLMNLILGKLKRTPTEASIQKTVVFGDCFGSIYEGSEVSRNRQHWQFRQYRGSIGSISSIGSIGSIWRTIPLAVMLLSQEQGWETGSHTPFTMYSGPVAVVPVSISTCRI